GLATNWMYQSFATERYIQWLSPKNYRSSLAAAIQRRKTCPISQQASARLTLLVWARISFAAGVSKNKHKPTFNGKNKKCLQTLWALKRITSYQSCKVATNRSNGLHAYAIPSLLTFWTAKNPPGSDLKVLTRLKPQND